MGRSDGQVTVACRAKLNLVLEIIGRRADGYHDLASVMHPITLADTLEVCRGRSGIALTVTGLPAPAGEANIVFRAARVWYEAAGSEPAVTLCLHKVIPTASGLGGGSADAAGTLFALAQLHQVPGDSAELRDLARRLGADVPFFLGSGAALAEGVGERLTPLPAASMWLVLAVGSPGVSTRWAYEQVRAEHYTDGTRARRAALSLLRRGHVDALGNGFVAALAPARPDLVALMEAAEAATGGPAGLTGSGSCVFALAADEAWARRAAQTLNARGVWTWWGRAADRPLALECDGAAGDQGGPRR